MYNNDYTNMQEPRKYLIELGLSDSEVTVYLHMLQGIHTASEIIKATQLKRPTVYYALGCLEKRGLISKTGQEGDKKFYVEGASKLALLAEEKVHQVTALKKNIQELIPFLSFTAQAHDTKPTVTFHEGTEALKGVIMEMLYTKEMHIYSIVPRDNFFWQLGEDFVERYVNERLRKHITTKNLWEKRISPTIFTKYYKELGEVRILPEVMHGKFETSIFIYDNKTLYVASKKNNYAVLITSEEHARTMLALFEGLWCGASDHDTVST